MSYPLASNTWDQQEILAIQRVIDSGRFTMGPEVSRFEQNFAERFGSRYAVMVNSGSSANLLMIAALVLDDRYDLSAGDEVIVPAVSWSTTYFPLAQYGLKAVFVDIDIETLNIDPEKILAAITDKTKAILAVNLLGNSCDYHRIKKIAQDYDLILIEDNCESLGASFDGKMLGTIGTMGTFSFFFSHHMQTMEGGMILTNDEQTSQYLRSLRAHGWIRDLPNTNHIYNKTGDDFNDSFRFVLPGYCVRPLEMSGAIGSEQLKKLSLMLAIRRANATIFREMFSSLPGVLIQKEIGESSWFGFSLVLQGTLKGRRKLVLNELRKNGVETRPIVAGNFVNNPVISYIPHRIAGKLDAADYIDQHGFFIGNDSRDLSDEIMSVRDIIRGML